ncbi:GrpB family protein [Nonomuraea sp. NPDC059007]|uniref:GrpB family protein n=1 Tax=Nonomuraea sp. NPDC059007 TaxID=3346692 RepID=UPI00367A480F
MSEASIQIVPYDPAWPARAATAMRELREALPGAFAEIEHIGSTAVPDLAAKPIIDLMAAADLALVERQEAVLTGLGYERHFNDMSDRLLYVRASGGVRAYQLHVVTLDSWPRRNQRFFRDYLREYPADAARYAELKQALAATGIAPGDYARAKTELIQELTDRARQERGLPSVPVWEK